MGLVGRVPLTVLMRRRWAPEPGRQGDVLRVGMWQATWVSATCEELDGFTGLTEGSSKGQLQSLQIHVAGAAGQFQSVSPTPATGKSPQPTRSLNSNS